MVHFLAFIMVFTRFTTLAIILEVLSIISCLIGLGSILYQMISYEMTFGEVLDEYCMLVGKNGNVHLVLYAIETVLTIVALFVLIF